MGSPFSTFADSNWSVMSLSLLCAMLMYKQIKQTFVPRWSGAGNVITKGKSASTVTLYVFRGSGVTISSSPFSSKLEMYCRLTGN